MPSRLTWCEVSRSALVNNIKEFRKIVGDSCLLGPVVKANAYGHGLVLASKIFEFAKVDLLCVNDLWEADKLRSEGIMLPILCLGYIPPELSEDAVRLGVSLVVYDETCIKQIGKVSRKTGKEVDVFIKVETGTNRQGVRLKEAIYLAEVASRTEGIRLVGVSSHFADIEDTTDHTFARGQMQKFEDIINEIERRINRKMKASIANSAATILWTESHKDLVRIGISAYGMWPSKETFISAALTRRDKINLVPALTWKTKIVQIKEVPTGEYIGYGRTYRTTHPTKIAVLPVGYYDGYDRKLSNNAYVLIKGMRAQVRGRVCMNMVMVDVTDIPDAKVGDEVVLLGRSGAEAVTAELMASWAQTINYEITTRINDSIPRVEV